MSTLLSTSYGAAVPIAGGHNTKVFGGANPTSPFSDPRVIWKPVPASVGLLSNVYSPFPAVEAAVIAPPVFANNGTVSAGPWTQYSTRTYNVVTPAQDALIPQPTAFYPKQYAGNVMGTSSPLNAAYPFINAQNSWWPEGTVTVLPGYVQPPCPYTSPYGPAERPILTRYLPRF